MADLLGKLQSEMGLALSRLKDRDRETDRERKKAYRSRAGRTALPDWFDISENAYFCGLIARQIRTRAHMRGQTDAAREMALAIADMIETGDFDWLV